jgi:hypothetical protein
MFNAIATRHNQKRGNVTVRLLCAGDVARSAVVEGRQLLTIGEDWWTWLLARRIGRRFVQEHPVQDLLASGWRWIWLHRQLAETTETASFTKWAGCR